MNSFMAQPEITSWGQVHNLDTLIQFYTNCYNYLPQLFIIAGLLSAVVGWYIAVNREKVMYNVRILIMVVKNYIWIDETEVQ